MTPRRMSLAVVAALAVTGCTSVTVGPMTPASPAPPSLSTPNSSPSSMPTYAHSTLTRSAERILTASRDGQVPPVTTVALRHDMTGLTVYFQTLPPDQDDTVATLAEIAGVEISVAQGEAPTPT